MPDKMFYVGSESNKKFTGYVPAKFLVRNGSYVMDPTPGGSQKVPLFSDGSGNNRTPGSTANPNNYLIVPANHSEQQAQDFARGVADTIKYDESGMGVPSALVQMIAAFGQGGSQDLQRSPQWGIPKGSAVPAFVGSASDHLGYVSAQAGFPIDWPEIAGGAVNAVNGKVVQPGKARLGFDATNIDTSGPHGLSQQNAANIAQGYAHGIAASQRPSPFDDYRYDPQPQPGVNRIGDGNGITGWVSSLSGIDPDEPTPPAWPPQADQSIRYLSSRHVQ